MTPLKIEVTEAMIATAKRLLPNVPDVCMTVALEDVFQDPEFVRQIREQVGACIPEPFDPDNAKGEPAKAWTYGHKVCGEETRASLGRLLGEG